MKLLRQLLIILAICFLGEALKIILKIPVPGNVIGMIILLVALCTGIIKIEMIKEVSDFLLSHLAFFFIPAGVGLISCLSDVKGSIFPILMVLIITTIIIMAVTGIVVQLVKRGDSN